MARYYRIYAYRPIRFDAGTGHNRGKRAGCLVWPGARPSIPFLTQENLMSETLKRALLVIDVQNEYVTGKLLIEHPPVQESLRNIELAMDAAQAAHIPVIVVQHDAPEDSPLFAKGSAGWALHPAVAPRACDHRINKTMASVFAGTDLAQWLAQHHIDT